MKRIISIGEALIDMISIDKESSLDNASGFIPKVGGAPLNVCGAISKLGGNSSIITMLGNDPFGDKIINYAKEFNIDTSFIKRTNKANTSLAFVSRKANGERDFSFYRKIGADMLLDEDDVKEEWFKDAYALHFCSVDLGDFPMRKAHEMAINYARKNNLIISFDPNLRFQLWDNLDNLKETVNEFINYADIIKISDEELSFITGYSNIEEAVNVLFRCNVKLIIYTCGKNGAYAITKKASAYNKGYCIENAVDTTGAGDGFIGSFLYQLESNNIINLEDLTKEKLEEMLKFSNKFSAYSVLKEGSIASYPTKEDLK